MKHFILPIALGLALVSCNRDNDNKAEETPILPVKVVETREDGDLEMEFKYNGNKLTEIIHKDTQSSRKSVVEYTGDFITSVINYDNNKKVGETIYKYEYGKLVEEVAKGITSNGKEYSSITTHIYNKDGTITKKYEDDDSQYTDTITMANGNIEKRERYNWYTTTYTYDTKNNPFKNVKGMSALVLSQGDTGALNNILERVEKFDDNYTYKTTYTYQYKNDFPTERVYKHNDGDKTYKTTFTYNK